MTYKPRRVRILRGDWYVGSVATVVNERPGSDRIWVRIQHERGAAEGSVAKADIEEVK